MKNQVYTDLERTPEKALLCEEINAGRSQALQDWVYHYNPYTRKWYGIHRSRYIQYWGDHTIGIVGDTVGEVQKQILDGLTDI